jgi:hypothetical protein
MKLTLTLDLSDEDAAVLTDAMKQENARLASVAKKGEPVPVYTLETWIDEMLRNTVRNAVSAWQAQRKEAAIARLRADSSALIDLSRLAAVIDAPAVKAAVEAEEARLVEGARLVEEARQAEAQAGEGEK